VEKQRIFPQRLKNDLLSIILTHKKKFVAQIVETIVLKRSKKVLFQKIFVILTIFSKKSTFGVLCVFWYFGFLPIFVFSRFSIFMIFFR
jgi:hypothetical protein